jgi:putative phage-type endonuclease
MNEQGTDAWLQERAGLATSSEFHKVLMGSQTATRKGYMAQLVCERLTGKPIETYVNADMEWGTAHEPEAMKVYEAINEIKVKQVGFIKHDILQAGASPDGLVGDDGLIEIKCPKTVTQIEYLISRKVPSKYIAQMQGQMWVTGRKWCDFVSYDPRLDPKNAYWTVRVERDDVYIDGLEDRLVDFLNEVDELVEQLSNE